jgi:hypothetical protein
MQTDKVAHTVRDGGERQEIAHEVYAEELQDGTIKLLLHAVYK